MFFWNSLAFLILQQMLAILPLVPLPFLKPAWTSGSSHFMYCWSLAWRILSITLLACEMSAIAQLEHSLALPFLGLEWKLTFSSPVATAEFSRFAGMLSAALSQHHLLGFEIAQLEFCWVARVLTVKFIIYCQIALSSGCIHLHSTSKNDILLFILTNTLYVFHKYLYSIYKGPSTIITHLLRQFYSVNIYWTSKINVIKPLHFCQSKGCEMGACHFNCIFLISHFSWLLGHSGFFFSEFPVCNFLTNL